jgi:hypothetical protein
MISTSAGITVNCRVTGDTDTQLGTPTLSSKVLFEKLALLIPQSRNSPYFMEHVGSLPCSQQPETCHYPYFASPHSPITFLCSLSILSSHPCLGLPSGLFLQGFPTTTQYAFTDFKHVKLRISVDGYERYRTDCCLRFQGARQRGFTMILTLT